ncbi:hypothetical protein [Thiomonas arsenitoxydans]|uniref:hypothetical protein n=1 Tax=Thiomonas arsenitoxydans (strain DSM 22701 / CIP 110005 / 3As) TaxID=426114 RepID=UPI001AC99381|nr:hypothetical protein [Thiomonas arsenitoxydans]MBN8776967.1 hypothetical protein [Thiomonas arsenitoxydans]
MRLIDQLRALFGLEFAAERRTPPIWRGLRKVTGIRAVFQAALNSLQDRRLHWDVVESLR